MNEREEDLTEERQIIAVDDLFDVSLPEADFEVRPGKWMRLRALSRAEMTRAAKLEDNRAKQEQYLVSLACLEPKLTEADVARWQRSAAFMELERVGRKINELGGIGKDAAKSDLHEDGDQP
ncbi:MAG: hypothetical protein ACJ72N_27430 [Labedaea sp.]